MRFSSLARITFFLTFIALFIYFYSRSGKFRKSIACALVAAVVFLASPENSRAKDVLGFTPKPQQQSRVLKPNKGLFGNPSQNSGPGKPDNPSGNGNGKDFDSTPEYHGPESVGETEKRLDTIDGYLDELDSQSESDSESESSCEVMPTQMQAAKFLKNGKVDLQRAFDEVNRRASMIGCENFDCSFERFKGLATECGNFSLSTTREAITILEGEMRGYFKNARRGDYGPDVTGLDYRVEGLGEFDHITHVEIKGAVSSSIRPKPTLVKQAKKFVTRMEYQKKFWSNKAKVNEIIPHIRPDALPESPNNVLGLYDLWDVGTSEKSTVSNTITTFSENDSNIVILNKDINT